MKFKFVTGRPTFKWPVTVKVPQDGGSFAEETFTGLFRVCPRHVMQQHLKRELEQNQRRAEAVRDGGADAMAAVADYDAETELLREYLIGWEGVVAEDGTDVPFAELTREEILQVPFMRRAISEAYWQAMNGEAKRKN